MDENFLEEIKSLIYQYKNEIPNGLEFYYKDVLAGNNDEAMANMFSMSIEDLRKYAIVCKIIADYNDVCDGLAIIDDENVDQDERQDRVERAQPDKMVERIALEERRADVDRAAADRKHDHRGHHAAVLFQIRQHFADAEKLQPARLFGGLFHTCASFAVPDWIS